jgi:hypothetical protein
VGTYTVEIAIWNLGDIEPVTDMVVVEVVPREMRPYLPILVKNS